MGLQFILQKNGRKKSLKGVDSASVKIGDCVVIKTPGGGGFGESGASQ